MTEKMNWKHNSKGFTIFVKEYKLNQRVEYKLRYQKPHILFGNLL
jgi:magnesium-transporting ATPase (P-type)